MSTDDPETKQNPLDAIRENKTAVETLTDRHDDIGASARVLLALTRGERPERSDLAALGLADDFSPDTGTGSDGWGMVRPGQLGGALSAGVGIPDDRIATLTDRILTVAKQERRGEQ